MDQASAHTLLSRLGGEIPAFGDRIGAPQAWRLNWLPFSHGRAALAWLLERRPVGGAVYCAYTCETVAAFFRGRGLPVAAFDIGSTPAEIAAAARTLPRPRMVLVPSLFGAVPWFAVGDLEVALDPDDIIVIDAAQTAFGHIDFAIPSGGAVLSCPRKTTALSDGAVLAVEPGFAGAEATATLPAAEHPAALKLAARALWATENPEVERQGVALNTESEESWPDRPCRMSDLSQALLPRLDVAWHRETRRRNRDRLAARLDGKIPFWSDRTGTPFSLPIFAGNRPDLLKALHAARVFASPLWPDAPCDSAQHPLAAWFAANLVSLPIDQRHRDEDIDRIAAAVLQAAEPAKAVPSGADRFVTRP